MGPEGVDDVPVGWIIEASLGPLVGEVRAKKKDESANYQSFWPVATAGWIGDGSDLLAHIEGAEKIPEWQVLCGEHLEVVGVLCKEDPIILLRRGSTEVLETDGCHYSIEEIGRPPKSCDDPPPPLPWGVEGL